MYSIYDQNLIFVIYEGGFSGSFLAALLKSIIDENLEIKISDSGHAHESNTAYDHLGMADFPMHLENCADESIDYFNRLRFSDKSTYVIRSHALDVEKNLRLFPKCKQIVISRDIDELRIGRVLNWRKYMVERCLVKPSPFQCAFEKIKLLMAREYEELDISTRNKLMGYILTNCCDPDLLPLYSYLSFAYEDPYPFPTTFTHSNIKYLPFSKIVGGDVESVTESFEFALGYNVPKDAKVQIQSGLDLYIQAQDSELLYNTDQAIEKIINDSHNIVKKLISDRPWESADNVDARVSTPFKFLILSSRAWHNLISNLCADANGPEDYFNKKLNSLLNNVDHHLTRYHDIVDRINSGHALPIIDTYAPDDFYFMAQSFKWSSISIMDDCGLYDFVPLPFFNSIVLKYHTSVNDLVDLLVELYPEFSDCKEWVTSHHQTREVNEVLYALWVTSKWYDHVKEPGRPIIMTSAATQIKLPNIRSGQLDELTMVIESILGKELSDEKKTELVDSVNMYNKIMFAGLPMVRRDVALNRIIQRRDQCISWLRTHKP